MQSLNGSKRRTAIVIGAGAGGVSTAARLAKAGFDVTVLEKNDFSGGRCSLIHRDGYRFDQGPSLLLLPQLFHKTFAELDTSIEAEGVELRRCDPNYNLWFGDGECFHLSSDLASMKLEIEKWEGKDGYKRYLAFLQEAHEHYELSVDHVLLRNFESLLDMLRWSFMRKVFDLHPFESIWSRASRYFWTERLRRVFTFASMYMGMSPFDAPGTYSLLQYTELAEGIWYPVGGFHRIVEALEAISRRLGVNFRFSTPVASVLLSDDGSRALGVKLETGEVIHADVIVNNSDLVYAYNNLLPSSEYSKALAERPTSCSSISFYWGLSRRVPELVTHNIFLADQYEQSFDSIFKHHLIPDEPSFYVNVPSRMDSSAAPEGKDTVVVLVPVGHILDPATSSKMTVAHDGKPSKEKSLGYAPTGNQDWSAMITRSREKILATIQSRIGVDLQPLITTETTNDPTTWRTRFNLDRGAILGLSHSFFNVLCFRPTTRARKPSRWDRVIGSAGKGAISTVAQTVQDAIRGRGRDISGLYMVGASTHPGTGVPIVLAGGRLVAEQILRDHNMEIPWNSATEVQTKGPLDRIDRPSGINSWFTRIAAFAFGLLLLLWRTLFST